MALRLIVVLALLISGCIHRNPAMVAAPRLVPPGPVAIEAERVRLECRDADRPRCDYQALYRVTNRSQAPRERTVVVFHRFASDLAIEVDGQPVRLLAAEELPPIDTLVAASRRWEDVMCQGPPRPFDHRFVPVQCWELCESEDRDAPAAHLAICGCPPLNRDNAGCVRDPVGLWMEEMQPRASAFRLSRGPGASREVAIRATVWPGPENTPTFEISAVHVRHFVLVGPDLADCAVRGEKRCGVDFTYLPATVDAAESHRVDLALRWPAAWRGEGGSTRLRHPTWPVGDFDKPWKQSRRAEEKTGRLQAEGLEAGRITAHLEPEAPLFHPGGPLLAVGGRLDLDDGWFRARAGYEFARPSWLLYALQLETDFQHLLSFAPTLQAATPSWWIIPSLGLGAGPLLTVEPAFGFGARLQATLQWPLVGLLASYDHLPDQMNLSGFSLYLVLSL